MQILSSCCAVGFVTTRRSPKVYRTAPLLRPRRPGFMQTKGLGEALVEMRAGRLAEEVAGVVGMMKHPSPFYSCILKTICLNIATDVKPRRLSFVGRGRAGRKATAIMRRTTRARNPMRLIIGLSSVY